MNSKKKPEPRPYFIEYPVAEEIYRLISAYGNAVMEATKHPTSAGRRKKERTAAKIVFKRLFGREPFDAELDSLIPG